MKATGTIQVPVRRRVSLVPIILAVGVALVAIGVGYVVRGPSSVEPAEAPAVATWATAPAVEDWGFVLKADTAQILRHRPGLEPSDFVRTHAFGWEGVTVGEVFDSPALVKELRLQPHLSAIDLIRMETPGS